MPDIKINHIAQTTGYQTKQQAEPILTVNMVKNSQSAMRFKDAAQFVLEMMPKKSIGEAGANSQYWLEIKDPKHRDRISLSGLDAQSGALGAWREDATVGWDCSNGLINTLMLKSTYSRIKPSTRCLRMSATSTIFPLKRPLTIG